MNKENEKVRYGFLDFLRGITLISMILYHLCWDLQFIFNMNVPGYLEAPGAIWQKSICITFILLSGFTLGIKNYNADLGKSSLEISTFQKFCIDIFRRFKRGIIVSLCGALITLVTTVFMPENTVKFGVLTFMGFAMIVCELLRDFLQKRNSFWSIVFCVGFYVFTSKIALHRLSLPGFFIAIIDASFYANDFTAFLGLPPSNFQSTDYFPVLPWIFMYLSGYFLAKLCIEHDFTKYLLKPQGTIFNFIGKHTLIIYMLHQPVIYLILMIVFR